jgi:hypothetical protein
MVIHPTNHPTFSSGIMAGQNEIREKFWLRLLVNAQGAQLEVSLGERRGVVVDVVAARARAPVRIEGVPGPIATQRQVDDDVVSCELLVEIALRVDEGRSRFALERRKSECLTTDRDVPTYPISGVDLVVAVPDCCGRGSAAGPKPDTNAGCRAFHSEPAASVIVERGSEGVRIGISDTTPCIAVHESVTIRQRGFPGLVPGRGHGAPSRRVEGHRICAHAVHTFEDVNFTPVGPVIANLPKGRPCSTPLRHVYNIDPVDS